MSKRKFSFLSEWISGRHSNVDAHLKIDPTNDKNYFRNNITMRNFQLTECINFVRKISGPERLPLMWSLPG